MGLLLALLTWLGFMFAMIGITVPIWVFYLTVVDPLLVCFWDSLYRLKDWCRLCLFGQ